MAKKTYRHEVDRKTGKVTVAEVAQPKKAKRGDFDIADVSTRGKRIARALWH